MPNSYQTKHAETKPKLIANNYDKKNKQFRDNAFRIQLFLDIYERNLRTFLEGEYANQANWLTGNSVRPVHNFFRKSDPNVFVFDQEQARTRAEHFASSVVSTRKTRRHLVAFHD